MKVKQMTAWLLAVALMITGMYIPVNPVTAFAKEVELTDSGSVGDISAEDSTTAGEAIVYVRSAKELVSALNGKSVSGGSVKIQVESPYTNADDYKICDGDVNLGTGIVIPENTNMTLNMSYHDLSVSDNLVQSADHYLKIKVPKSSSLTMTSSDYTVLPFSFENQGTLMVKGKIQIRPEYGNGILNTGSANLEGEAGVDFQYVNGVDMNPSKAPVYNDGGTFIINTKGEIFTHDTIASNVSTIINKNGSMAIESGYIGLGSTSGNTIMNEGSKAVLEIRGGIDENDLDTSIQAYEGNAIMNNGGKVSLIQGTKLGGSNSSIPLNIQASKVGILNYNGGSLDMYGGTVRGGTGSDCAAIATTPYIDDSLTGTVSAGSVKIIDGNVGYASNESIGIAYAKESLPVLLGGVVRGKIGAVVEYKSKKALETDVTKYAFQNSKKETIGAYIPENGVNPAFALNTITRGLNPYATQTISYNALSVSTFQQLKDAVSVSRNIILANDIVLDEDLAFNKDTTLHGAGYKISINKGTAQITIGSTAKVRFEGSSKDAFIRVNAISENEPAILNQGELSMNEVQILDNTAGSYGNEMIQNEGTLTIMDSYICVNHPGLSAANPTVAIHNGVGKNAYINGETSVGVSQGGYAGGYGVAIQNEGNLYLNTRNEQIYTTTVSGVSLFNTGRAEMKGSTYISSGADNAIAVKNQGQFVMEDGTIGAKHKEDQDDHSYAILYDEYHLPQLNRGIVEGAHYGADFTPKSESDGSAVSCVTDWTTLTTKMGSFKDALGLETPGNNSSMIVNGIPQLDTFITIKNNYILMEKGEVLSDCVGSLFTVDLSNSISGNATITSTSANVLSVSKNSAGKWTAKAEGTGMSMLRMEMDETGLSDYIRVEVVEDREKLIGESYQGGLLNDTVVYNAYRRSTMIPLEWHLKSSYDVTAGTIDGAILDASFEPTKILLESQDPDFEKYFQYEETVYCDSDTKQYSFRINAVSRSIREFNYLVSSEIKGFSDIKAKLRVVINGKTETIDIGTFDIKIDSTEPEFKYNPITLNSAYLTESYYGSSTGERKYPNKANLKSYIGNHVVAVDISLPNGFTAYEPEADLVIEKIGLLSYTGKPKSGSYAIPATVYSSAYNGYFETKIPVKVINEKPKVEVTSKKVTVANTTSDVVDIPMTLISKTELAMGTVQTVEIMEKNSSFAVVNSRIDGDNVPVLSGKNYTQFSNGAGSFYLQPRKALKKAEKVTLKFTYKGARGKSNGSQINMKISEPSDYTTTSVVSIAPTDISKATMKQTGSAIMVAKGKTKANGVTAYDDVTLRFSTTPSNYEGGYFVVTGLNGKELTGIGAGPVTKFEGDGYKVKLYANEKSKAGKTKFSIYWYDKDGKQLGKPLTASVILKAESELTFANKNVIMDINKESSYDKSGLDTTAQGMGVALKYKATNDWYKVESLNPNFEITVVNETTAILKPTLTALRQGKILPGKRYFVDLYCINSYGDNKTETIQVDIKDYKDVKAKVSNAEIYKEAPYMQSFFRIETSKPAYGIYVTKVEITDANTPFEVKASRYLNSEISNQNVDMGQQAEWTIACKDHKYNSKMVGKQTVNMKLTYQNGKTATAKMNVLIK